MVLAPSGGSLQDQGHLKVTSGGGSLRWRFVSRLGFQQIAGVCLKLFLLYGGPGAIFTSLQADIRERVYEIVQLYYLMWSSLIMALPRLWWADMTMSMSGTCSITW